MAIKPVTFQGVRRFRANLYALEVRSRFIDQSNANGYYLNYGKDIQIDTSDFFINRNLKIQSGAFLIQGRMIEIEYGTTVDVNIPGSFQLNDVGYIVARLQTFQPADENELVTFYLMTKPSDGNLELRQDDVYHANSETQNLEYNLPIYEFRITSNGIDVTRLLEAVEDYNKVYKIVNQTTAVANEARETAINSEVKSSNAVTTANNALQNSKDAKETANKANNIAIEANETSSTAKQIADNAMNHVIEVTGTQVFENEVLQAKWNADDKVNVQGGTLVNGSINNSNMDGGNINNTSMTGISTGTLVRSGSTTFEGEFNVVHSNGVQDNGSRVWSKNAKPFSWESANFAANVGFSTPQNAVLASNVVRILLITRTNTTQSVAGFFIVTHGSTVTTTANEGYSAMFRFAVVGTTYSLFTLFDENIGHGVQGSMHSRNNGLEIWITLRALSPNGPNNVQAEFFSLTRSSALVQLNTEQIVTSHVGQSPILSSARRQLRANIVQTTAMPFPIDNNEAVDEFEKLDIWLLNYLANQINCTLYLEDEDKPDYDNIYEVQYESFNELKEIAKQRKLRWRELKLFLEEKYKEQNQHLREAVEDEINI